MPLVVESTDTSRLLRRVTYGLTDADVQAARRFGYRGFVERQLDYAHIDDSAVDAFVAANYPLLSQSSSQLFAVNSGTLRAQLQQSTLYRAAFSNRQLYQRMVEFVTREGYDVSKLERVPQAAARPTPKVGAP